MNGTFVTEFCEPEGTRWPIHAAARNGHVACLIELLVRGAEVHSWPFADLPKQSPPWGASAWSAATQSYEERAVSRLAGMCGAPVQAA